MRIKENYTLYKRKLPSGKTVYYYRTYAPDGRRTAGKSTGQTSKAAARRYCDELLKTGMLYTGDSQTFAQYAAGFFDDNSPWVIDHTDTKKITKNYIKSIRSYLNSRIMPFFGPYKLAKINPSIVKIWRSELVNAGYAPGYINVLLAVAKMIFDTAISDGLLMIDPMRGVNHLRVNTKTRAAFTIPEIHSLLHIDPSLQIHVLIGACTGMRIGEIMAIREDTLYDDYIDVRDQWQEQQGIVPVKTKEARKIPCCHDLHEFILDNIEKIGGIKYSFFCKKMHAAVRQLPVSQENGKLSFHSLRHFFNTYLLAENVPPHKVAAVLGHSTGTSSMQERYTNWKPEMFPEVYTAQKKLFSFFQMT